MRVKTMTTFALATALGAALALGGPARAGEQSPRERVEQLVPRLQSPDDTVRENAEKELFRMGDAGRREIERLSRDPDTRRALLALRLLQSDRWTDGRLRDGERPLERAGEEGGARLDALEREMEQRFAEVQKAIEEALRGVPRPTLPEWPKLGDDGRGDVGALTLQGTVIRGDRKLTWRRAADGEIRVTTQDGDGEEREFVAPDVETFRTANPELAAELDEIVPTWTGAPTVRLWDGVPELRIPPRVWRWWHDEDDAAPPPDTAGAPLPRGPVLGIQWGPVSPLLRHHLRLGDTGVVVESVVPDTLATRLQMEPMDVLVELAGRPIRTRSDIGAALRDAGEKPVEAVVVRRGERRVLRQPE